MTGPQYVARYGIMAAWCRLRYGPARRRWPPACLAVARAQTAMCRRSA